MCICGPNQLRTSYRGIRMEDLFRCLPNLFLQPLPCLQPALELITLIAERLRPPFHSRHVPMNLLKGCLVVLHQLRATWNLEMKAQRADGSTSIFKNTKSAKTNRLQRNRKTSKLNFVEAINTMTHH